MTNPSNVEGPHASTDDASRGADRGVRLLPLVGACLACCVPMLLVLGVVSSAQRSPAPSGSLSSSRSWPLR